MLMNMDPKARDENGQWKGRQKWMLSKLQEEGIRIPCNRENSAFTQSGRSELFNRDQIIVDFNFILNPVQPQNINRSITIERLRPLRLRECEIPNCRESELKKKPLTLCFLIKSHWVFSSSRQLMALWSNHFFQTVRTTLWLNHLCYGFCLFNTIRSLDKKNYYLRFKSLVV